jgi:hypothetical protein
MLMLSGKKSSKHTYRYLKQLHDSPNKGKKNVQYLFKQTLLIKMKSKTNKTNILAWSLKALYANERAQGTSIMGQENTYRTMQYVCLMCYIWCVIF